MSTITIFLVGLFVALLCAVFFIGTVVEMKKLGSASQSRNGDHPKSG